jgi:hypothetical protein
LGADDTADEEEEGEEAHTTTAAARERGKAAATGGGERSDAAIGRASGWRRLRPRRGRDYWPRARRRDGAVWCGEEFRVSYSSVFSLDG